ncbi:MAG TPA: AIR synthase family protein [Sunxiuqinia sp.]|nr:AIR synthase family protein [Sunxiuqinia sp.]
MEELAIDTGKLTDEFFKTHVYPFCGHDRKEVLIGPAFGTDVSIVQLPNGYEMALTSDPLSYLPALGLEESAWLSVQLMANDMATTGVAPQYAQLVLNLPNYISDSSFKAYWKHIHQFCEQLGVAITGGHTARYEGLNSTISGGGTMIATAPDGTMICSQMARPGDRILVTKEAALVSTAILARSFPQTVKSACGIDIYQQACELFYQTSSLQDGLIAASLNTPERKVVHAMHDVTECGVLGAIYEMAIASGCGAEVETNRIPAGEAQQKVCMLFDLDPLLVVGAGSMILAVSEDAEQAVIEKLTKAGIATTSVGRFTNQKDGLTQVDGDQKKPLTHPGTDPYWKAFFDAFNNGLK